MGNKVMHKIRTHRGVSLIAAIFIIVILAFMGVMFVSMISTGSLTAVNDLQSAQALYVAEGGTEYAENQFENGTICGNLNYNNITLGQGSFTTTGAPFTANSNLTSAITNADTVIPVGSVAGFAPQGQGQGRIRIEDEEINYAGTSAVAANCAPYAQPCFTGVDRGVAGTNAVLHNLNDTYGVAVSALQNQCRITSTGTVGSAVREVVVDVPGYASAAVSAFLDGTPTLISSAAMTKIGSLKTELATGNNLIVVVVALQNTSGVVATINAGNFQLRKGAAILAQNQNLIRVVGTTVPVANNFPQETQFLLYRDNGAAAYPTYDVVAQASANNRISAKVKMVVFNNVPNSYFFDEPANVALLTTGTGASLSSRATGLPAGDNIILAAVQLYNNAGANRTIFGAITTGGAGYLSLRRGGVNGTVLASNQLDIGLERNGNANESTGVLLIARDAGVAANQTYTVAGRASGNTELGEVKMLVFNGVPSAFLSTGRINPVPTVVTTLGNLATTFPAGHNIIIAGTQYWNADAGNNRNIVTDQLVNGALTSANVTPIYLDISNQVDDYTTGLLLHHTGATANATYSWQSQASGANVQADTDMVAIHLDINSIPLFGWREVFP